MSAKPTKKIGELLDVSLSKKPHPHAASRELFPVSRKENPWRENLLPSPHYGP